MKAYDELSGKDTSVPLSAKWERVGAALSFGGLLVDDWASRELSERWSTINTSAVTKFFWPEVNGKRSSESFAVCKVRIFPVVDFLINYCHNCGSRCRIQNI